MNNKIERVGKKDVKIQKRSGIHVLGEQKRRAKEKRRTLITKERKERKNLNKYLSVAEIEKYSSDEVTVDM